MSKIQQNLMKYSKLTQEEINQNYENVQTFWSLEKNKLICNCKFPDFSSAFSFLTEVAILAEKMDHHPTIINTYGNVSLEIWTHDVGGLTKLDFEFAETVNKLLDVRRNLF